MGRVIVVANQKGGVGKTTTVANLGAALAEQGHEVLLLDIDPQAALTASFGVDAYNHRPTTYSLLMRDGIELGRVVQPLGDNLWLAPAGVELSAADYLLSRFEDRTLRLRRAIAEGRDKIDFILIDTPPSLGLLTVNALAAADELLIPVGCQYLAMRGVRSVMETVWLVQERVHPNLQLLGLLPTMYRPDSPHSQNLVSEMRSVFDEYVLQTVIEVDEAAALAPTAFKSVLAYQPESPVAVSYRKLAEEICHI